MSGREFEDALAALFELDGYVVERTAYFDDGADLVLVREGVRVAVQAKRSSRPVRVGAVRALVDGMRRYSCERGRVVTNNYFTAPAVTSANVWGIELWDRGVLSTRLEGEAPEVDPLICAACGFQVTEGVSKWCLERPARYDGAVYCIPHQRRRPDRSA